MATDRRTLHSTYPQAAQFDVWRFNRMIDALLFGTLIGSLNLFQYLPYLNFHPPFFIAIPLAIVLSYAILTVLVYFWPKLEMPKEYKDSLEDKASLPSQVVVPSEAPGVRLSSEVIQTVDAVSPAGSAVEQNSQPGGVPALKV